MLIKIVRPTNLNITVILFLTFPIFLRITYIPYNQIFHKYINIHASLFTLQSLLITLSDICWYFWNLLKYLFDFVSKYFNISDRNCVHVHNAVQNIPGK